MARDNKSLTGVFNDETVTNDGTSNSNTSNVTSVETITSNTDTTTDDATTKPTTVKEVSDGLLSMYDEKRRKKTVEDTHIRTTFLFDKELEKRLSKLAKGKRGFKTMFFNEAIRSLLDELEGKNN